MAYTMKNELTAMQLAQTMGCEIELIANPQNNGNIFFTCGTVTGGVGNSLKDLVAKNESIPWADVRFAEISKDGGNAVPCLFLKGSSTSTVTKSNLLG